MWFHFLLFVAVTASAEPLYRIIGDKVVLTPDSVVNPINNIVWNHGPYVAMVWHLNAGEPLSHRQFKDRGSLNISTGVMTITGLTRDDSGIYTVEINDKVYNKTQLNVISPVPEPTISVLCDPEMTYCVLTCSGSITGAEPVTYWWTAGGKRWPSTNQHTITKEDKEEWFNCTLENPVSSSSSEKVFNLFIEKDNTWKLIFLILPISLAGLIISVYFRHKYRKSFRPQWQYERLNGGWWDFGKTTDTPNGCSVTNDDIETWYQKKPQDKMSFTVKGVLYKLDFDKMIQTNLEDPEDHKVRKVRREMMRPE
ncbi:uncharacterized protein LOC128354439 isoform X2 [Scomber scombrus]|uniref:Uncharacterized protein LOC128354439 isoform X2 n=1 Tax=Scomber scombrus TaxID=13677 RepID=A0AAV1PTW7_SCOSC